MMMKRAFSLCRMFNEGWCKWEPLAPLREQVEDLNMASRP